MTKKLLFTTFILLPLIASADNVSAEGDTAAGSNIPLDKCNATNVNQCEVMPVHQEIALKDKAHGITTGTLFITSTPREASSHNGLKVEVQIQIQCKDSSKKQVLIKKMSACGYPKVRTEVDLEAYAFKVIHDPELNILEDGKNITLKYKDAGTSPDGYCGEEKTIQVANPCSGNPSH